MTEHDAQADARCELEQQLLGWQLSGMPGAVEFASAELRQFASSFLVPHGRVQVAILKIADAERAMTVTNIAAELGDYPAFHDAGGIEYLRAMAGAAPATSPDNVHKRMAQALLTWQERQQPGPKVGCVELVRGDLVEPEPVHWLWNGWLAHGKLHILAGQPSTGKTSIAVAIGAAVTSGGVFPDGSRAPVGTVLIWSGEDDFRDTLLPRFIACGGARERLYFVSGRYDENCKPQPFDPAEDMEALGTEAAKLPDLRLIIVDPVVSVVPGDSHRNAEVRRALQPLIQLAQRTGAAVMGLTHLTKGTAGREPLERITGSLAFGALPRLVWYTVKSSEASKPSRLVRAKSNIGPDGDGFEYNVSQKTVFDAAKGLVAQAIQWGEPLRGSARDLIADLERPQAKVSALDAAMTWLVELLGNGPVHVPFIQNMSKQVGHAWATVERAKKSLGVESVKLGSVGCWAWRMPKVSNPEEGSQ
jgi:hypothetical protein